MKKKKKNNIDIALSRELKLEKQKFEMEAIKYQRQILNYSQTGASTTKIAFRDAYNSIDTTREDIEDNKEILMARSRQLFMGNSVARGAIFKIRTNVVGDGLKLKSRINNSILQLPEEEVERVQKGIENIWKLWADSTECDILGENTFNQIQELAIVTQLLDGECFVQLPYHRRNDDLFDIKVKFLDPAKCKSLEASEYLYEGVESDDNGVAIAYHFEIKNNENIRIPVYDSTGRKQILKIMERERIGQVRGVPLLASVLEIMAQLTRFSNAELMNAVVSAMFTAFIKQDANTGNSTKLGGVGETFVNKRKPDNTSYRTREVSMGYGNFGVLEPGQDLVFANPNRPNSRFEAFFNAMLKQVGAALEIPFEVLLSSFAASYSASRASLLEVWKMYKRRRKWLSQNFCQPIFEQVIEEAVLKGYINLPGFLENPISKRAYLNAEWYGNAMGQIDPIKEVNASILKVKNGFSTLERESMELNGSDWNENLNQQAIEMRKKKEVGLNANPQSSKKNKE
ncbi:phage portal protein [Fusobacterium necrophorum]|uniref:phage portal protein n=1 Tax=Fusobacterium necrophorum TaxID=859 RepID=UPI00254F0053|nr:phage portal protein [Fusobacterium necrophorum]MDK4486112.1 phage portal protein [Fusobacterium necrophorum]